MTARTALGTTIAIWLKRQKQHPGRAVRDLERLEAFGVAQTVLGTTSSATNTGSKASPSKDNTSHKGLIVPAVSVEVDETSLIPFNPWDTPRGSIVCLEGVVGIRAELTGLHGTVIAMLGAIPPSPVEAALIR